jgi:CheY-like chemotaxis protein
MGTAQAEALDEPRALVDSEHGKIVMVIDDNELVRDSTRGLLKSWGCLVVTAESEDAAMAKLAEPGRRPDLIISDYHLAHGKAGFELIDRLRRACGAQIPAFLISGDTAPERLRDARVSGYYLLQKPVLPITLRSVVSQLLKNQPGEAAAPELTIAREPPIRAPAAAASPAPPLQ